MGAAQALDDLIKRWLLLPAPECDQIGGLSRRNGPGRRAAAYIIRLGKRNVRHIEICVAMIRLHYWLAATRLHGSIRFFNLHPIKMSAASRAMFGAFWIKGRVAFRTIWLRTIHDRARFKGPCDAGFIKAVLGPLQLIRLDPQPASLTGQTLQPVGGSDAA